MVDGSMRDNQPITAIDAFRMRVLDNRALHARLGVIEAPDIYVDEAMNIATAQGIALSPDAIRAAIRPDPLGIGRFMPSPVTLDRWPSNGWLPARPVETGDPPAFDWAWFGPAPLTAPFYEDSVRRFAPRPFSQMFRTRTSLAALVGGAEGANNPAPSGFIHHMSRCGSTLVAQMLAADPSHIVLSEPAPFDAVVRWAMVSDAPLDDRIAALRAIVAALGRDRSGQSKRLFLKLDAWHAVAIPLLRAAFPDTPWVFLYRDPVEVMVSQLRQRGIHTVPGLLPPSILNIPGAEGMPEERYAATVMARLNQAVLDHWHVGGGMLVNYDAMPSAILDRIAPHFGFVPDATMRNAMALVATRDAKAPAQPFVADTTEKRLAATARITDTVHEHLAPIHDRLEALRRG